MLKPVSDSKSNPCCLFITLSTFCHLHSPIKFLPLPWGIFNYFITQIYVICASNPPPPCLAVAFFSFNHSTSPTFNSFSPITHSRQKWLFFLLVHSEKHIFLLTLFLPTQSPLSSHSSPLSCEPISSSSSDFFK